MTSVRPVITVKIDALREFSATVQQGLGGGGRGGAGAAAPASGGNNPFDRMFTQWDAIYSAFSRKRFNQFSRGGGDWPALALSTIQGRRGPARGRDGKGGGSGGGEGARISAARDTRKGGKRLGPLGLTQAAGRTVSILRDTGQLMSSLSRGHPGHRVTRIPKGIQVGFNDIGHTGGVTMGQLATWHHFGMGNNPARTILVDPDAATRALMVRATDAAVRTAIAQSKRGAR